MAEESTSILCRDCFSRDKISAPAKAPVRCVSCGSPRLLNNEELFDLTLAHIDCDAFYAAVEKRDNPDLLDKPVIIGGETRGVVSTACYLARMSGVRSAMPMFKALKLCPKAIVIKPNMEKYTTVGREIRRRMRDLTPLVEPLSIDEAFLDMSGTEKLREEPAVAQLARFASQVAEELGITVSIGLSHNKLMAKLASDIDKPRGFTVIGEQETMDFLAPRPVSILWGVGKVLNKKLNVQGIEKVGDLRRFDKMELMARHGSMGERLYYFCRGIDPRKVSIDGETKSISSETTFNDDIGDFEVLKRKLWPLSESVSRRAKKSQLSGHTVTLKLKDKEFINRTRSQKLAHPTCLAEVIYQTGLALLEKEATGQTEFRLIGIGISTLGPIELADPIDLADPESFKRRQIETAMDDVREKLGKEAINKGRLID